MISDYPDIDIAVARKELKENGVYIVKDLVSSQLCNQFISSIGSLELSLSRVERNYNDSEARIWNPQNGAELSRKSIFKDFCIYAEKINSAVSGRSQNIKNLLAIWNKEISADDRSVHLGRWHVDSVKKQFKVFLFLNDVDECNGAFEYLPNSFTLWTKFKMTIAYKYFHIKDFLPGKKKNRAYQSIDDTYVDLISPKLGGAKKVLCKAGTIMLVDTTMIHRASPCLSGERYALTAYF